MGKEMIDGINDQMRLFADKAEKAYPAPDDSLQRAGYITACQDFFRGEIPKVVYGWLIESKIQDHNGPYYLCVLDFGGNRFEWKPDHQNAIRFCREEDATRVRDALRELRPDLFPYIVPMAQAVQHAWSDI